MILSTQYYRPPFPQRTRWKDDLAAIRSTGLDAIVLTGSWAWAEPEPGRFEWDDYDELVELAAAAGLKVIVNLFAELQPVWIHRELPDAHMIDHMGHQVVSSPLSYAQFGIVPGGCTDHPQVRELSARFITTMAQRYAAADNLLLWDCWNEMRWLTQSDGLVCHCSHTLERYRHYLRDRYGDLDGLNAAWHRRYRNWQDVVLAKGPARTYTDAMAYQAFLTRRIAEDLARRAAAVRAGDPDHPVTAHTMVPSAWSTGEMFPNEPALARGNDWELADAVDGFGSSHFPAFLDISPMDYGARLEAGRCATGEKPYWIAELQGGAAGHGLQAMRPVTGDEQARWLWSGIARGATGVSFWCWRDETFGREAAGFGIAGDDGHAADRLAELRVTANLFAEHCAVLDAYRPLSARVGLVWNRPRTS